MENMTKAEREAKVAELIAKPLAEMPTPDMSREALETKVAELFKKSNE